MRVQLVVVANDKDTMPLLVNDLSNELSAGDNHWSYLALQLKTVRHKQITANRVAFQHLPTPSGAEAECVNWGLAARITVESPNFLKL